MTDIRVVTPDPSTSDHDTISDDAVILTHPLVFDRPIETPVLVLRSHDSGIGIARAALDDGTVITYTYHASPIPSPTELKVRFDAAKAAHLARKTDLLSRATSVKNTVTDNMSMKELKAAVLALQAQIEILSGRMP